MPSRNLPLLCASLRATSKLEKFPEIGFRIFGCHLLLIWLTLARLLDLYCFNL